MQPMNPSMQTMNSSLQPMNSSMQPMHSSMQQMHPINSSMQQINIPMQPTNSSMQPTNSSMQPMNGYSSMQPPNPPMQPDKHVNATNEPVNANNELVIATDEFVNATNALVNATNAPYKLVNATNKYTNATNKLVNVSMQPMNSSIQPTNSSMQPMNLQPANSSVQPIMNGTVKPQAKRSASDFWQAFYALMAQQSEMDTAKQQLMNRKRSLDEAQNKLRVSFDQYQRSRTMFTPGDRQKRELYFRAVNAKLKHHFDQFNEYSQRYVWKYSEARKAENELKSENPKLFAKFMQERMRRANGVRDQFVRQKLAMSGAQSQIPGVQTQMPGAQSQIPGPPSQMPGVQSQMPGVQSQMPGAQSQMPGVQSQMSSVLPKMPGAPSQMYGAQSQIPGVSHQIQGISSQIPGISPQMSGMLSQGPGMLPDIPSMSQQLSGISPQMPSVSSQVPGVQSISEIQPQIAGVSSQMQNGQLQVPSSLPVPMLFVAKTKQIPNSGPSRSPTGSPMPPSGLSQEPAKVSADVYFASNGDTAAQQSKMLHAAASLVKQESSNPPDEDNDWAKCCKCHQWRIIMRYSDNWKDNPKWECAMNEDPKYHRCNVPQEVVTKTQKKEVEEWRPEEDVESSAGEDDDENDEDFQVGDEDGITRKRGRRGSGRINKPTAAAGNDPSIQIGDPYSQIINPQVAQANHPNMHQQQFIAQQQQYLAKLAQQQQMEIMQQGRQQLLQQGGQQFMQSVGQQFMQSGGQQFMQSGIQQLMQPGGQQFMQPGGQQFMQPGVQQFMQPGGQQFMQSAAQRMQPGGQQFILPPSQNFMQPTSQGPAANNEFMKSNEEWTQEETKAALQFVSKHGFSNEHLLKTHPILRLRHTSMAEVQSRVSHLYSRARSKGIAAAQPTTRRGRPPPNRKPSASDELFLNSSRGVRAARRREQRFVPTRRRLSDFLSDSEEEEEETKTGESSDSEDDWEANPRRARRPVEASRRSSRRLGTTPVKSYCEDSGDERFLGGDRYVPEKPKHSIDKLLATRLARMRVDAGAQSDSDDDGLYDWRAMARKQQQSGVNEKAGKTESANAISEPQTQNLSSAKNLVKSQTFGPNSPAAADQESIDGEDLRFRPGWHPEKVFKDPREMTRAPEERWAEVRQFLTKIKGEPYSRCLWFTEEQLSRRFGGASTRSRVQNFMKKRHEIEARNEELWGVGVNFEPDFLRIDRVVSSQTISRVDKETNMSVPVEMFLVVWGGGSSYSNATWETAAEINSPEKINEYRRHNTAPSPPTTPKNPKFLVKEENKFKNGNTLRDYQLAGVNWLVSKFLEDRNCILADEMGLGKTVQTISFLQFLYFRMHIRGPFLIVAPLSTIRHWKREIEEWTELNVVLYYDPIKGK
eukprot:214198_1